MVKLNHSCDVSAARVCWACDLDRNREHTIARLEGECLGLRFKLAEERAADREYQYQRALYSQRPRSVRF